MTELNKKRCVPCEGGTKALDAQQIAEFKKQLRPDWQVINNGKAIQATFTFKNYAPTTAFVNAVIFIAHQEDHHPDITFTYKTCTITYWTHAIDGLSENDFICAAKVDALLA